MSQGISLTTSVVFFTKVLTLIATLSEEMEIKGWSGQLPILKLKIFQLEGSREIVEAISGLDTATLTLLLAKSIADAKKILLTGSKTIFGSTIKSDGLTLKKGFMLKTWSESNLSPTFSKTCMAPLTISTTRLTPDARRHQEE